MSVRTFFPLVIDSTMLMEFDSCQMSGFRKYIQHLTKGAESTDLIAGAAFAKGMEIARKSYYNDRLTEDQAVALGREALQDAYGDHIPYPGSKKTSDNMGFALEQYFMAYPMFIDQVQPAKLENGEYAIEYSFAHELPIEHPDLPGQNIIITGRADMLGTYANRLWVVDEKTTGSYFSKDWAAQWDTRGQFTTYCWGLKKDSIKVAGAYIRGISMAGNGIKFAECQTNRSDFETETWEFQMLAKVQAIVDKYRAWKQNGDHPNRYFFGAWNESCNKYFKSCQFKDACRTRTSEQFLAGEYSQYIWLPHQQKRMELNEFLESIGYV